MAVVEPKTVDQVVWLMSFLRDVPLPFFVAGEMSNVLFDSEGFDGVILRVGDSLSAVRVDGTTVRAQAGASVPELARMTATAGLSGLEHTVGIPGTIGGLVTMNGGSQRKGVGDVVARIRYVDLDGVEHELSRDQCEFAYRSSALQRRPGVVTLIELVLQRADPAAVHASMDAVVESRKSRFPEDLPNCGSTFLSDPSMYETVGAPGKAIEAAGLKGFRYGDAQISEQHANFVVNTRKATSSDVLHVIRHARDTVHRQTGFTMNCEVRYVSPRGDVVPAHDAPPSAYEERGRSTSPLATLGGG
jgi:UDP-N-acetylmuramate dehydrogenase